MRVVVTREHRLMLVERVVDLAQGLLLGVVVRDAVLQSAARVVRHRDVLQEVERNRAQARRIDRVADESARQIELPSTVARR